MAFKRSAVRSRLSPPKKTVIRKDGCFSLVKVGLGRIVRFDGRRPHGGRSPEYPAYLHQRKTVIRKDGCFSLVKVGLGENRCSNKRISFAPAKAPLWRRDGAAVQIHSVTEGRSPGVSRLSPHGLIKARCNCSALSSQGGRLCRNGRPQAAAQSAARWDGGQRSGRPTQEGELNSNFFAEQF